MAPEPPNESNNSPIRCPIDTNIQGNTSDESEENEEIDRHAGYEPLNMNENLVNDVDNSLMEVEESGTAARLVPEQSPFTVDLDMMDELQDLRIGNKAEEEPQSVEAEVVAEIWNKPRPNELNFDLDINSQELVSRNIPNWQAYQNSIY